jgi:hypothetical protein
MHHPLRLAFVAAVAGVLGTIGTATATAAQQPTHRGHVLEYVCNGKHYQPRRILIACGDGNAYVRHLSWSMWTRHKAHGHGVWVQNDCKPDCARGHFIDYPVRMRLSQVVTRGDAKIFGRVVGVFPHHAPPYPAYKHHRVLVMNHGHQAP